MSDAVQVLAALATLAADFSEEVIERQQRSSLLHTDFDRIRETGFLLTGIPVDQGGLWDGPARSARHYSDMVRTLAHGDPSVALVAAMHPAVTAFFLGVEAVEDAPEDWQRQRQWVIDSAREHWWGTITSEPGSGGDILKTRSIAAPTTDEHYLLTGHKHFGSGSGIADYMMTTAKVTGSDLPELFFMQYKDEVWDGSTGCKLTVPWAGMGMSATQSHAFEFVGFPAIKAASVEVMARVAPVTGQISNLLFTGVIMGVADNALAFARNKLDGKTADMRAFEQVEWVKCQNELWLAEQAREGALRAIEAGEADAHLTATRCKIVCADLIETALGRMAKVVGGASYSRAMPLAQWVEDVKALSFLRPPLPLAYDQLLV